MFQHSIKKNFSSMQNLKKFNLVVNPPKLTNTAEKIDSDSEID